MTQKPTLEYAPPPNRHRRSTRLVLYSLSLIIAGVTLRFAAPSGRTAWDEWRQRREMNRRVESLKAYEPPPGAVAFEEQQTGAAKLFGLREYSRFLRPVGFSDGAMLRPLNWYLLDPRNRVVFKDPMQSFHAVPFVHERRTEGGLARLVVVEARADWPVRDRRVWTRVRLIATTLSIDGPWQSPLKAMSEWEGPTIESPCGPNPLEFGVRIFAGRCDPQDKSHFWIEFEGGNGVKGTIDGYLRQSEASKGAREQVTFKLRVR
jgi:hypothetical protein